MSSCLFYSGGLVALARFIAPDTLFAFDLDGTLAPIVEDPAAARVPEPMRETLYRLTCLANVVVITGRSRRDAEAILGFEPHLLIGNHGCEWPPGLGKTNQQWVEASLKWREQLHDLLFHEEGIEVEFKGQSLSLHYRKAADPDKALSVIDSAIDRLDPVPRRIGGKYVVNVIPMDACDKGDAISTVMAYFNPAKAVYFGDDETDEAIFNLQRPDIFGIHIGEDDRTSAPYYLAHQSELLGLLNSVVGILELHYQEEVTTDAG
jgi:trehalose 6-phosphate phosphatase